MESITAGESGWMDRLRQANLLLFAALPIALLFSRGAADAMVVVIAISFLAAVTVQRRWAVFRQPVFLSLLVTWVILNIAVSPFALNIYDSYSRSLPWLRFVLFFAAVACWVLQTRRDVKVAALVWGIVLLGVAVDGLAQLLFGMSFSGQPIFSNRLTGPLDRPNIGIFAARIGLPLMAAWAWLIVTRRHQHLLYSRMPIVGFAALMMVFIFLTGERAASLLTIVALTVVAAIIMFLLPRFRMHGVLGISAIGVTVSAILLASERILDRATATVDVVSDLWGSIYGELIRAGLQIWSENPLTGVGLKNYRIACEELGTRVPISECNPHPHNIYVEWLSETGILGSLGFAAFLIIFLISLLRPLSQPDNGRIAGAFLAGSAIVTLFPFTVSQSFFSNWPAILLWSSLAFTAAIARIMTADKENRD